MARVQPDAQWVYLCGKGDDDGLPYVALIDINGKLEAVSEASAIDAANVTYTPADVSDWDGGVDPGSQADADDQLAARVKVLEAASHDTFLPARLFWFHTESFVVAGNAIAKVLNTIYDYNVVALQDLPAQNDQFTNSGVLKAGAYTIKIVGQTGNNKGQLKIEFKHVNDAGYTSIVSAQEWYSAATTQNVVKTQTFTVTTSGRHIFRFTVPTKNASSSNYYMALTYISIYLTAGDS